MIAQDLPVAPAEENSQEPQEAKNKNDKTEALRMWSAISFALIILGLGIPLWWKTTEVYRVTLPYTEIDELQHLGPRMVVNVSVYTEYPSRTNMRIVELKKAFAPSRLFDINLSPAKLDIGEGTVVELEKFEFNRPSKPGSFKIVETNKLQSGSVVLGNYRSLYFHPEVKTELIVEVVKKWVLREGYLEDMVASLEQPGSRSGQERRLKSEPCFDIVFTTVNPEPDRVKMKFDTETSIKTVIDPLLDQLKPVADLKVKSQWLYFVDMGQDPKRSPNNNNFIIPSDRIPHIISPLEKKLGSGVSSCPCLHFVLYIPRCSEAPLYFTSPEGDLQTAVVSPRWGGIQIHNPSTENCVNQTAMTPDMGEVAKVFVSHLRYLLDLRYQPVASAKLLTLSVAPLRGWEVDSLYRSRVLEQAISARLTLQSLARLLGEISNIVINEEVGDAIKTSVISISATFSKLAAGRLEEALGFARKAYITAEMAFSHPSLLALLYFPDDQKYAVYIPLFLPVMIPVVLSLKNIWKWLNNKPLGGQ
uniref:GPI transamidase component PIG-S n=1 Tax=Graphocephala atropunctata TaxID=36148 RepID=A0A1B6LI78_9HEMI